MIGVSLLQHAQGTVSMDLNVRKVAHLLVKKNVPQKETHCITAATESSLNALMGTRHRMEVVEKLVVIVILARIVFVAMGERDLKKFNG